MASYSRSVGGVQPALAQVDYADATISYADTSVFYTGKTPGLLSRLLSFTRALTGAQPFFLGTLARRWVGHLSLDGVQPPALGTLLRTQHMAFAASGAQPFDTGTLIARRAIQVQVGGVQPVFLEIAYADPTISYADVDTLYVGRSPGRLHVLFNADVFVVVGGVQPAGHGTLIRQAFFHIVLHGTQPAGTGVLYWIRRWIVYVTPGHEQGDSPNEYVFTQTDDRAYVIPGHVDDSVTYVCTQTDDRVYVQMDQSRARIEYRVR